MNFLSEPIITQASVLLTDSRLVSQPEHSVFFAIKGEHHDGHAFVAELYNKGVREFVVEKKAMSEAFVAELSTLTDAKIYLVENAIRALQNLVAKHRQKFDIPVIGVTGSNGKTIVKEWLSVLLAKDYNLVKSPRSYNSQIGVPLSVWELNENHNLGIFEAGISKSGEMEFLEPVIRPTIGIFTNIGSAHDEGFRSRKQKATEKLRLFQRCQVLIYCKDYEDIDDEIRILLKAVNPKIKLIDWSRKAGSKTFVNVTKFATYCTLQILWNGQIHDFKIPLADDASIENATHCIFLMLHLEIPNGDIQSRLDWLKPVAMRLELKQGINDCYLIDDSYNNDYAGLAVALNFMIQQHTKRDKVLIISDVLQSGLEENELYESIAELVRGKKIDKVIGIGEVIYRNQKAFYTPNLEDKKTVFYQSTQEFLEKYPINQLQSSLILVKGARKFEFEKIINRLTLKVHGTVFEVNLDALTNNLNFYRNKIGLGTKIMVMVKAFAYGSGSAEVASLLEYHKVDYLGVAYTDEGVVLRQNGIKLPIMVLNPQPESFAKLVEYNLEPEIYSFKLFEQFLNFTNRFTNKIFKIHLKIDTGMHRLGFVEQDIISVIDLLNQNPTIQVASIFSHLVGADESEHNAFSKLQIEKFEQMSQQILAAIPRQKPLRHICNSAGIIRFPEAKFDMVRLGIGLYGVEVTGVEQNALQTVGTLKTVISQIKHLQAGTTVGYSRKGVLERESKIATIAIGYADGFDRGFSKGVGKVLVNGVACPVVGNVCMDMTMIDVTDVECEEGDEVIIFGKDLSITELAQTIDTIPYEILTGVSERVKRVFFKE
ncbi:Alanine racemase [Emticicia oligotrophica DSM 17448]|uniref:Alanine racemase n=1 Tax=Emticicia oligotrophica (strain DSM 17448 / CIP 109782 / MTCC 6937 / GPTSA100-15) TaxID=929562 RepID=A0ABN4ANF2_EMTOG|nr:MULTISPECIES: bifunctional UDP-N-acetylmuramoyl-tripeptide:D-alanyl-D-alanine ligase/alanine racemase [Emticicia]AFK03945.1 Alanine racemase [Emticicia oligotrophica DSM 17448]